MAAVTHRDGSTDTTDGLSVTTPSVTVPSGELAVAVISATGTQGTDWVLTDSLSGTWYKAGRTVWSTNTHMTEVWVRTALSGGSSMTLTYTGSSDAATGFLWELASVSGMSKTGSAAVLQVAVSDNMAAATTATVTFGQACDTGNPTLLGEALASNAATDTFAGWTLLNNVTMLTPTSQLRSFGRDSGFTGTTITAGGTSGVKGVIAVELDASAAAPPAGTAFAGTFDPELNRLVWF